VARKPQSSRLKPKAQVSSKRSSKHSPTKTPGSAQAGGVDYDVDYIVIGSGFGGAVAALRLAQKGWRVVVLEKGDRYAPTDLPATNWNLRRWLWAPRLGLRGILRITPLRHVLSLGGAGVGGGSLVYAAVLMEPGDEFFQHPVWAKLAPWRKELAPHYAAARAMLGVAVTPRLAEGDELLRKLARQDGLEKGFAPNPVGIYFGPPGKTVKDPYFGGKGPHRAGCTFCGACMVGCRVGAKNSLDKNYLHLAERLGVVILPGREAVGLGPLAGPTPQTSRGQFGWAVTHRSSRGPLPGLNRKETLTARGVVTAGGVIGTLKLLLAMGRGPLAGLSPRLGQGLLTNNESLLGVTHWRGNLDCSQGVAIGATLRLDASTTLQAVRYPRGSGFWRVLAWPLATSPWLAVRLAQLGLQWLRHPWANLRALLVWDWARRTQILMTMRTLHSTLHARLGWFGLSSRLGSGPAPTPFMPVAYAMAGRFARLSGGQPGALISETLLGMSTTAHLMGGAAIGGSPNTGVVDHRLRVFGYDNLWVCDGSVIPANPGVNPSLTIAALAERAMALVEKKEQEDYP